MKRIAHVLERLEEDQITASLDRLPIRGCSSDPPVISKNRQN